MAGELTLTAASELLKSIYQPRLRMQLNDEMSPLYQQIERTTEGVVGKQAIFGIHTDRSSGTGARGEFEALPDPDTQKYDQATVSLKYLYGRLKVTGQVMVLAKQDAAVFVDAAGHQMERLAEDLKFDLQRQLFNDANQYLMITTSADAGQTVTFTSATEQQWRHIIIGMRVDIGSTGVRADGADGVYIASYNRSTSTITFTGNITAVTSGMYMRKYLNFGNERTGLPQIIDSGTSLHGIDGATVPVWNSHVVDAGTASPTESLLTEFIDDICIKSGVVPKLLVAPHDIVRAYAFQLTAQKRFVNQVDLKGGFKGVAVSSGEVELGFISDRFAPATQIWAPHPDYIHLRQAADWQWMDDDGSVLARVADRDAYEATTYQYSELTTDRRAAHGLIENVVGA